MSPNEEDKINKKLDKLEEYIDYLQKIKAKTKDEQHFLKNP